VERVGGRYCFDMGSNLKDKKKPNILYTVALDGRWLINLHTTTNQKQAPIMEESRERRQNYRGAWGGGCKSIVLVAIEWGVHIKTKINCQVYKLIFFSAR
jgi:hypothetical protein